MAPSGSGSAVGLFGLHSQTTWRVARPRPDGVDVERPAGLCAAARHGDDRARRAARCRTRYIA